jgi:hypothetical protein
MIQLFRVLLPSWKFFDGTVDAPILWHRLSSDGVQFDEWIQSIPKAGKRSWKNLFLNTRENYLFAAHALLEYLKNDFQEQSDPKVSLELVKNLVEFQIKLQVPTQGKSYFQFKFNDDYLSHVYRREG